MPEGRTEMVFMVTVTVPARLTATEVEAELGTCISFGQPRICQVRPSTDEVTRGGIAAVV